MILHHTDNLSRALQVKVIFAAEGQQTADMAVTTLQDQEYNLLWVKVGKLIKLKCLGNAKFLRGMIMVWLRESFMMILNHIIGNIILKPLIWLSTAYKGNLSNQGIKSINNYF